MKFLRSWLVRLALLLAVVGAAFWILSVRTYGAHDWRPLRVPLPLDFGTEVSEEFDTDLDGTYWVMLQIRSELPWAEEKRVLGKSSCFGEGDAEPILVPWELSAQGRVVASGDGKGNKGRGSVGGGEVGVCLGPFQGTSKGRYRLDARVENAVPELHDAAVHLAVEPDPMFHKNAFVGASIQLMLGHLALGMAAVLLLVHLSVVLMRRRRSARPEA